MIKMKVGVASGNIYDPQISEEDELMVVRYWIPTAALNILRGDRLLEINPGRFNYNMSLTPLILTN